MQARTVVIPKILITVIIASLILGMLFLQYFHGGVPSHHILQQKELPEISNWWGGLLLPVLAWIISGRVEARLAKTDSSAQSTKTRIAKIIGRFLLALILGISLAVSFTNDYKLFLENIIYILLALSLFLPIYYGEFILGFILGMTYTFGAILPTIFISIVATVGFIIHRFVRPLLFRASKLVGK